MKTFQNQRLLVALLCLLISVSCEKSDDENVEPNYLKYKLIAWNSLSQSAQAIVTHEWNEAEAMLINNPDDITDRVILVVFHTTMDALTCPIYVYVDLETRNVICPKNVMLCN